MVELLSGQKSLTTVQPFRRDSRTWQTDRIPI